jgi:hypothetical protein
MSLANDSLLEALAASGYTNQELFATNANSQNTAVRIMEQVVRVIGGVSNGSIVLPSILSGDAGSMPLGWVVNDSPNTIKLFPFTGESQNGVTNGSLSVSAGAAIFYYKEPAATRKGGGQTGTTNWHSNTVS